MITERMVARLRGADPDTGDAGASVGRGAAVPRAVPGMMLVAHRHQVTGPDTLPAHYPPTISNYWRR